MSFLFNQEAQEPEKHDRWMVSWADFVTLLFVFFLALFVLMPKDLHEKLVGNVASQLAQHPSGKAYASNGNQDLQYALLKALQPFVMNQGVTVQRTLEGLLLEIPDTSLFAAGTADLSQQSSVLVFELSKVLSTVTNKVRVEGHTDNVNINTSRYPSNWELSAARASSVVRLMEDQGIDPARLSASGYGPTRPVADNATEVGRAHNRRVSILILDKN